MDIETLKERREELAVWLATNLDSPRWEEIKREYNNLTYRIQNITDSSNVNEYRKERSVKEFRTPLIIR